MLKLITPRLDDFKAEEQASTVDLANNVFKVFHGFYGNLFLSKFVNGQTGTDGIDQGVVSARAIWSHGLPRWQPAPTCWEIWLPVVCLSAVSAQLSCSQRALS